MVSGRDDGLCQDYCRGLHLWFASRVDARHTVRRWFGDPHKPGALCATTLEFNMAKSLGGRGSNHYYSVRSSIAGIGRPNKSKGAPRPPLLSLREAAEEFNLPHRTAVVAMRAEGSPQPKTASKSSCNTYYVASELRAFLNVWKEKRDAADHETE